MRHKIASQELFRVRELFMAKRDLEIVQAIPPSVDRANVSHRVGVPVSFIHQIYWAIDITAERRCGVKRQP